MYETKRIYCWKVISIAHVYFFYKSLHYHEPLVLMHANRAEKASIHQCISWQ